MATEASQEQRASSASSSTGGSSRTQRASPVLLASVCCLTIGAHFSGYLFGPLALSLGGSRELAARIAGTELLNTISPFLAGIMMPRLGLGRSAVIITAIVALGLGVAAVAERAENLNVALVGWLIFGMGVSPASVVQEALLVRYASHSPVILGVGLLVGKMASWVAFILAESLLEHFGLVAPFAVGLFLGLLSLAAAIVCWRVETGSAGPVRAFVGVKEIARFETAFWLYLLVCWLSGSLWFPFIHLSPTFLVKLWKATLRQATLVGSLALLTPLILYPLVGYLLKRVPKVNAPAAFCVASAFTALSLALLLARAAGQDVPLWLSVWPFAIGRGFAPMLLVIFVTKVVKPDQVSTALGLHKSVEQAGASLMQVTLGEMLRTKKARQRPSVSGIRAALSTLLVVNLAQLGTGAALGMSLRHRHAASEETQPLLGLSSQRRTHYAWLAVAFASILSSWLAFILTRTLR